MQTIGYIRVGAQGKVLVLVRDKRYSRTMKLRKGGREGNHFEDEERFLSLPENSDLLDRLLQGGTIEL